MKFSIIIPVYNRPEEVKELLATLARQSFRDFEVLVVEDGSSIPCHQEVEAFSEVFPLRYFVKENGGPAQARNYAAERAKGEYLIILDSDCVLPDGYLSAVAEALRADQTDAFGGPDRAHESFTPIQKAINYAMTSFFTTGGIRGGKKKLDRFFPRSFNMGVRREVFQQLGGFSNMRFGEDVDFSMRLFESGFRSSLFPEAWVWHKRRTDLRKFFKQVHNSGIARIHLWKRHPGSLKVVHLLPAVFTVGVAVLLLGAFVCQWALLPLLLFALIIFVDASLRERSLRVGMLAVAASLVQLTGYGSGFLRAWWRCRVRGKEEFEAFKKNFYQ